jgi:hypothetical protein
LTVRFRKRRESPRPSMSFHLLNIFLKTGRLLAITPPSTETKENNRCRQMHQVLMIVGIVVGVIVSTYYKNFYLQYNLAKITVCLLTDCVLCAFCCRIIVEASRVRSWRGLVDGLEETASLVQDEDAQTSKVVFKFLGLQVVFWGCTIYIQTYWVTILGMLQLKQYSVEILETYIQFFYTFYICTVLEMIRKRYESLRRLYEHRFVQNGPNLVQMSRFVCSLKKVVNAFNDNFGYSLILLICFTTLQFLNYLDYNLQSHEYGKENLTQVIIAQVLAILISFVSLPLVPVSVNCNACCC